MEQLKKLSNFMAEKGIPIPYLRDPKTKEASVSVTMVVISFNLVLLGIIGKYGAGLNINLSEGLNLFEVCCAIYFGRGVTSGSTKVDSK